MHSLRIEARSCHTLTLSLCCTFCGGAAAAAGTATSKYKHLTVTCQERQGTTSGAGDPSLCACTPLTSPGWLASVCLAGVPAAATHHVVLFDAAASAKPWTKTALQALHSLQHPLPQCTRTAAPVHAPCAGLQPRLQAGALAAAITVPVVATLLAATLLLLWWHKRQRHASKAADAGSSREHSHAVLLTGAEEGHAPKQVPTGLLIGCTSVQCCRHADMLCLPVVLAA